MHCCYLQVVGGPCGYHGPYIFYKAIRITKSIGEAINSSVGDALPHPKSSDTTAKQNIINDSINDSTNDTSNVAVHEKPDKNECAPSIKTELSQTDESDDNEHADNKRR